MRGTYTGVPSALNSGNVAKAPDRGEGLQFLSSADAQEPQAHGSKIKILSSCYSSAPENTSALLVVYHLTPTAGVAIRLGRSVRNALMAHCQQSIRSGEEVAGVLAGYQHQKLAEAEERQFCVDVTDVLPIQSSDKSDSHIRVDEQSWGAVERTLLELSSSQRKCKLGWYHTHPTQGIFFSRGDWDAHGLFPHPYQFAMLIDPGSMEACVFYWSDYDRRSQGQTDCFSLKQETE